MMHIETLSPDPSQYAYAQYRAKDWTVSLVLTITGNTRVHIWKDSDNSIDHAGGFPVDWCCGNKPYDINRLLNVAFEIIDLGLFDETPLPDEESIAGEIERELTDPGQRGVPGSNNPKPYYNDQRFMDWLDKGGYCKIYINLESQLPTMIKDVMARRRKIWKD